MPDDNGIEEGMRPFSERIPRDVRPRVNLAPSRAFVILVTFIILVPLLITLIIDFSTNRTITWSFYPVTSLVLLWILIAYPSLLKGHTTFQVITMDILSIAVFLMSLDLYSSLFLNGPNTLRWLCCLYGYILQFLFCLPGRKST